MSSKIDHAGTTPGLVGKVADKPPTVNMKCKNPSCDSIEVVQVHIPDQPHQRVYKCVKCHRSWGANVGGAVNL